MNFTGKDSFLRNFSYFSFIFFCSLNYSSEIESKDSLEYPSQGEIFSFCYTKYNFSDTLPEECIESLISYTKRNFKVPFMPTRKDDLYPTLFCMNKYPSKDKYSQKQLSACLRLFEFGSEQEIQEQVETQKEIKKEIQEYLDATKIKKEKEKEIIKKQREISFRLEKEALRRNGIDPNVYFEELKKLPILLSCKVTQRERTKEIFDYNSRIYERVPDTDKFPIFINIKGRFNAEIEVSGKLFGERKNEKFVGELKNITESKIVIRAKPIGQKWYLNIDRFTGAIDVETKRTSNKGFEGFCEKISKRKF